MKRGLGFLLVSVLRYSCYIAISNLKHKAQKLSPRHSEQINYWCIYNHHKVSLENPLWCIASETTPVTSFHWGVAHYDSHRFKLQTHFEQTLQNGSLAFVSISILQSSGKFPSCTHLTVCCSRGLAKERWLCAVLSTQCSLRAKQQLFLSSLLSVSDNNLYKLRSCPFASSLPFSRLTVQEIEI